MHRHGARYPLASELVYITQLVEKLGNTSAAIQKAKLPDNLAFLKGGYASTLGHDDLTAPGRMELFQHGVECVQILSCANKRVALLTCRCARIAASA